MKNYILLFVLNYGNQCEFWTYNASRFGLATFHVVNTHRWLVAIVLSSTDLYPIIRFYSITSCLYPERVIALALTMYNTLTDTAQQQKYD